MVEYFGKVFVHSLSSPWPQTVPKPLKKVRKTPRNSAKIGQNHLI